MTWLVALLPLLVPLLQTISQAWGSATGNSLQKVGQVLAHAPPTLVDELTTIGATLFPTLSPTLHAAAAALLAAEAHTGAAAWVQAALNFAQAEKVVTFNGTGMVPGANTPLTVDGLWGPRSMEALKAMQAVLRIPTTGMFADAEVAALQAILSKV